MEKVQAQVASRRAALPQRRVILYFLVVGAVILLLLPRLISFPRAFALMQRANSTFLLLALAAEIMRYIGTAGSTYMLTGLFRKRVPFWPLTETMMAGQAANRTVSAAGAAGMVVRFAFLNKQGLHSGQVAALFAVEDVAGALTVATVFLAGLVVLLAGPYAAEVPGQVIAIAVIGGITIALACVGLYLRRSLLEGVVHGAGRAIDSIAQRFFNRSFYKQARVQQGIDEFYIGVHQARLMPGRFLICLLFNFLRVLSDAAALYFAFLALGFNIGPGPVLLMFSASSTISTLSAVPGEFGVMETSLAAITLSLGVPREIAMVSILLFRIVTYWLPIPLGYLALWDLRRLKFL